MNTLWLNKRMGIVLLLSFASGLPYTLSNSTLQAWYKDAGIGIVAIGMLSLASGPYIYKFLWAPLFDRYLPPCLTRRRGWIVISQLGVVACLICMAFLRPDQTPLLLACFALLLAFLSASQDVVIDAHRTDLLTTKERGLGAAFYSLGYRLGFWIASGPALIIAGFYGWQAAYLSMAAFMLIGVWSTYRAPESEYTPTPPSTLKQAVVEPWRELMSRHRAIGLLLLILLYKLGDSFAFSLVNPFLLDLGFNVQEVGLFNSSFNLVAIIIGTFIGGWILTRIRLFPALLIFGLLQALSNLAFMLLAVVGKNYAVMAGALAFEYLCFGMGNSAIIALMMTLCHPRFSATQFALFSAIAALSRVYAGPIAGVMVSSIGWVWFYGFTFLIAFPGILVLLAIQGSLREQIAKREALDKDAEDDDNAETLITPHPSPLPLEGRGG